MAHIHTAERRRKRRPGIEFEVKNGEKNEKKAQNKHPRHTIEPMELFNT